MEKSQSMDSAIVGHEFGNSKQKKPANAQSDLVLHCTGLSYIVFWHLVVICCHSPESRTRYIYILLYTVGCVRGARSPCFDIVLFWKRVWARNNMIFAPAVITPQKWLVCHSTRIPYFDSDKYIRQ